MRDSCAFSRQLTEAAIRQLSLLGLPTCSPPVAVGISASSAWFHLVAAAVTIGVTSLFTIVPAASATTAVPAKSLLLVDRRGLHAGPMPRPQPGTMC